MAAFSLLYAATGSAGPGTAGYLVVNGVASLAVAVGAGWFCGRYFERVPFRALGAAFTKGWLRDLTAGLVIGAASFAAAAGIGIASGGLSFRFNSEADTTSIAATLIFSFTLFASAAAFEEALFRGYPLQTFLRSDLAFFAVFFTSALFATVHNANPNATLFSWGNTFLAGLWFAVAYLKTRSLWLPFGLHLAWNWTQGSIFGVEVSGLTDIVSSPLMRESDTGPAWLTGGEYGIEGGLACSVALILSTVLIYFLPALRRDQEMLALTSPQNPPDTI